MSEVGSGATDGTPTEIATIVTASRRLARRLREDAAHRAIAAGLEVWATPDVLPWASWTKRLWRETGIERTTRRLLRPDQALALWSDHAANHPSIRQSLDLARAIPRLYESWQRFCDWGLSAHDLATSSLNSDQAVFADLVQDFARFLREENWLDQAQLNCTLCSIELPFDKDSPPVRFFGFQEFSRTERELVEKIAALGVTVHVEKYESPLPGRVRRVVCENKDQELLSAGAWARARLEADPGARIAIVVPGLSELTSRKAGLVRDTLVPGWQLSPRVNCLNVSYGKKLNDYPLIAALVALVDALLAPMSFDQVSQVLRNPVLAGDRSGDLARLELAVRGESEQNWDPAGLIGVAQELKLSDATLGWLSEIRAAAESLQDWREINTPEYWAQEIDQIASRFDQFATAPADSEEYQLRNAWREILNELAGLTVVLPRRYGTDAWLWVKGRLSATVFQPESIGFAVELLGPLEALGQEFDGVWFSGLDAAGWPMQRAADPFIPRAIQKSLGMPGADPNDSVQFSNRVLWSVLAAGGQPVVSSARNDGDVILAASPSIVAIPVSENATGNDPDAERYAATLSRGTPGLVVSYDQPAPVLAGEDIRGGYSVLATQRDLPLAAFVQFRLGAKPIEPAVAGIGARARGNLIHRSLETLLPSGTTRDVLLNTDLSAGSAPVRAAVRQAARGLWRRPDSLLRTLIGREERRCAALIAELVETERGRPDFSIVDAERQLHLRLGALELRLRIDRVDRTAGGTLIVDYKTGRQFRAVVRSDASLRELQLAAYAMALGQVGENRIPAGLAIARLDWVKPGYFGAWFSEENAGFGSFRSFAAESGHPDLWYDDLTALGADFCRGAASLPLDRNPADLRPWQLLSYGFCEPASD